MSAPGGIGYGPLRHSANGFPRGVAGHADEALGLGVIGLHLVVVDGPVGDVGAVDRTELGPRFEVDGAKARELAVGVEPAAADGRREVVDLAGEEPVAVAFVAPVAAWFEERVGTEEVPAQRLDLVVRDVAQAGERLLERQEMVAPLLEHDHRPARAREHVGRGRPRGPRADDDGVAIV